MFFDTYYVPEKNTESALRERGSRFLAYLYKVQDIKQVKELLQGLKQQYPDATHHCYAYVLGTNREIQFATDDGEPGNSAGKPILRKILSSGLTHCMVVVVRYFGGTQLGIPGLIKAYGDATELVLKDCGKKEEQIKLHYSIEVDFSAEGELQRLCARFGAEIFERKYEEKVIFKLGIVKSKTTEFENLLKASPHIFRWVR